MTVPRTASRLLLTGLLTALVAGALALVLVHVPPVFWFLAALAAAVAVVAALTPAARTGAQPAPAADVAPAAAAARDAEPATVLTV